MSITDTLSAGGKDLAAKLAGLFGAENVTITSGARPNGRKTSQHYTGDALDIKVKGMTGEQVQKAIAGSGITYGQLINEVSGPESTGPHVHVSTGTGKENLRYVNGAYIPVTSADLGKVSLPAPTAQGADSVAQGTLAQAWEAIKSIANHDIGKDIEGSSPYQAGLNILRDNLVPIAILGVGGLVVIFGLYRIIQQPFGSVKDFAVSSATKLAKV